VWKVEKLYKKHIVTATVLFRCALWLVVSRFCSASLRSYLRVIYVGVLCKPRVRLRPADLRTQTLVLWFGLHLLVLVVVHSLITAVKHILTHYRVYLRHFHPLFLDTYLSSNQLFIQTVLNWRMTHLHTRNTNGPQRSVSLRCPVSFVSTKYRLCKK
jgi:hypothetical protein